MKRWRTNGAAGRCLVVAALAILLAAGWLHEVRAEPKARKQKDAQHGEQESPDELDGHKADAPDEGLVEVRLGQESQRRTVALADDLDQAAPEKIHTQRDDE